MSTIAHFRNLREENSSGIPAHWICRRMSLVFKLLSVSLFALNNCKPVELELCSQSNCAKYLEVC